MKKTASKSAAKKTAPKKTSSTKYNAVKIGKNLSKFPSGVYRVRKMVDGVEYYQTFTRKSDAVNYLKSL